ncbi:MAG TPA: TIR domain-containing protein [Pyrinomonadaceae bacterium]|nr:TIR domain-containing protein [Pyrinomonadaceae bacterium]
MSEQTHATTIETPTGRFAVFLSHNSREKPTVERIAEKLKRAELEPWLDKWCLTQGGDWQNELAQGLRVSSACAVFVGPHGIGSWEDLEYKLAVDRMAKDRGFRVFLVLLPGLPEPFDTSQLPPFLSTRTWVDLRKGIEDARSFQSLINAIKGLPLGPERPIEPRDDACPYRGLQAFDEEHAELFFGREGDIQRLVEKLKTTRFLAVLGASGSGKSSLVRAGVVPRVKRGALPESDTWAVRVFTPGAHPLANLAANLLRLHPEGSMNRTLDEMSADERTLHLAVQLAMAERPASEHVVWVVDQFEEIFTLCTDEKERAQFLANLLYAAFIPGGRNAVVLTLRADFYQKCAAYPELSERIAANQFLVSPMDEENLKQAIEEPAWHVGLEFEHGLVETILNDIQSQPGALPLLEHALLELWERRRGNLLTLEAYRESGGVQGAIAKRADAIYDSFTPEQQQIVRRIMLRLTQPGEGTEDTRRRASMDELVTRMGEDKAVEDVTQTMTTARLLTTDTDEQPGKQVVDVSHEALIRGWPRLRKWIEEDRAGLRILRRLTEVAREWQPTKDESLLYRGARLAQACEWRERNEAALNELEREFLDASLAARRAVERRKRHAFIALAAGLVVAVALAVLAVIQWRRADAQAQLALSRQLAAESYAQMENRPDLGLLLGVEANRVEETFSARRTLLLDMLYREHLSIYLHGPADRVNKVVFSPDGKLLAGASGGASGRDNSVWLWDAASGQPVGAPLAAHKSQVNCVAFSPDGKLLASGDSAGGIIVWDVATRQPLGSPLTGHLDAVHSLAFSADSKTLASGGFNNDMKAGEIYLWDVVARQRIAEPLRGHTGIVRGLAFSPDGRTLASGNGRPAQDGGTVIFWDVAARRPLGQPLAGHKDSISCLAFSPDGTVLASGSADKTVRLWDVAARGPLDGFEMLYAFTTAPHKNGILDVQFTRDGKTLISVDAGSPDVGSHVLVRAVEFSPAGSNKLALVKSAQEKAITTYFHQVQSVSINPETFKWAASGGCWRVVANNDCLEGEAAIWDIKAPLPIAHRLRESPAQKVNRIAFSPDGKLMATGGCGELANGAPLEGCRRGEVELWDTASFKIVGRLPDTPHEITSLAYSPDGKTLAAGSCAKIEKSDTGKACRQDEIRLWNLDTGQLVSQPLTAHGAFIKMLAFSPDGRILASAGGDSIILWDSGTRQVLGKLTLGHQFEAASQSIVGVHTMAFSPDGKTLVSGGCGKLERRAGQPNNSCGIGELRFWDVATRQMIGAPLAAHTDQTISLAFSPDGKTLASASGEYDDAIKLWDVATRQATGRPLTGYDTDMVKMTFSPDGKTLITAATMQGENKTYNIFLWDLDKRQIIGQPITAHTFHLDDIALSPDGRVLASAGSDFLGGQRDAGGGTRALKLWDMKLESWIEKACRVANRNIRRAEWELYFPGQKYRITCPNLPEPKE